MSDGRERWAMVSALVVLGSLTACDWGCGAGTGGSSSPTTATPALTTPVSNPSLGTNVAAPSYVTRNYPFVDLMRQAGRTWISGIVDEWDDGRTIDVDERGWVRRLERNQIARTFLIAGDDPAHLSGEFTVRYEGQGEIEYLGRISNLERGEGRDTFELSPPDGLFINITSVDPADPLRNIQVIAPGGSCASDASQQCSADDDCAERCVPYTEQPDRTFHADFLAELEPFDVLRFMDWQQTNRILGVPDTQEFPLVEEFDELPSASSAFWQPVPVAVMVQLANDMDADPWFSIPHSASDDFVRNFAEAIAATLEPDRKVYIEHSNEVWNGIFDQHYFVNRRGCELYSDDPRGECLVDGELCGPGEWGPAQERCRAYGVRYHAERTAEIGRLFREVFEEQPERVVNVLGAQIGMGPSWVPGQLNHTIRGRPVHEWVDAVAVAPYFGGGVAYAQSLDELFRKTRRDDVPAEMYELLSGTSDAEHGGVYHWLRTDLEALESLRSESLHYIAYEGGQHLHTHEEDHMSMLLDANRDPRMEAVYTQFLRMWHRLTGGSLFVHYTTSSIWGQYGGFGAAERQGTDIADAPKRRALEAFAAE